MILLEWILFYITVYLMPIGSVHSLLPFESVQKACHTHLKSNAAITPPVK